MEICPHDKRVSLEIRFDDDGKVSLARCCFLYAFSHLTLEEYGKIDDIIDYAENSKVNYAKSSNICVAKCYLEKKIKQVDVGISHACNMHCLNCFFKEHKDTPEMKKAYFDTLYKIKGHQLDTIMMNNGGEVFVYYDEIIEYLKSLTPKDTRQVTFVTNLVLLNEKRFKELKQISNETGVTYFFLPSVDGIKKESYEAIRLGGTFEKITENLHLLANIFGPQQAVILYTIKKPNINETKNVEKYFMDTFGIRCSISFDVYDKDCEEKYNSIFRKDYTKEEKEVSKKEDSSFKFLEKETVEKRLLTVVTEKVPSEKDLKRLGNKFYIFLLCKRAPKYINNYNNIVFIKTSKRNFYKNLILKIYTKFFIYVKDISSLVINDITILNYFLNKTDKQVLKIINSYNSKVTMSSIKYGSLILNTNFFKKHFYNIENSKNIQNDFIKNTNYFLKVSNNIEVPEEIIHLFDEKNYKDFFKWNFVQI
jgi:pyruvate-formate lyase-activating enzyme